MNISYYRKTLIAAAAAATFGLGATACSETGQNNSPLTDGDNSLSEGDSQSDTAITAKIKSELSNDNDFRSSNIDVSTSNGVVTLEGDVADSDAKSAAEQVASNVSGVNRVNNRLSTSSDSKSPDTMASDGMDTMKTAAGDTQDAASDTWITTKVKSSLLADSEAEGFDISVETNDGVVTLTGELDDGDAVRHAEEIAAGVKGVKSVNVTALTISALR